LIVGSVGADWSEHVRRASRQHRLGWQMGNPHVRAVTSTFCLRPSPRRSTWRMGPDRVSPAEYALLTALWSPGYHTCTSLSSDISFTKLFFPQIELVLGYVHPWVGLGHVSSNVRFSWPFSNCWNGALILQCMDYCVSPVAVNCG